MASSSDSPRQILPSAEELTGLLRRHVIDAWFPRSLDLEFGGFLSDFDIAWRECGPQDKLSEFQTRHAIFAAEASLRFPDDERLRRAATHGFDYLKEMLWDSRSGGWFHRLDRAGRPLEAFTKHAHGLAYGIQACAAAYRSNAHPSALALAQQGFEWLETHGYDARHGGYFEFYARDGEAILDASNCPWKTEVDSINTPLGCKDLNVHSDLVEVLYELYLVWPDRKVLERLAELVEIMLTRMRVPCGGFHFLFRDDWTPLPHLERMGYTLMTVKRLLNAGEVLGRRDEILAMAVEVAEHAIRHGRDHQRGGYFYACPGAHPHSLEGQDLRVGLKSWWVEVEALGLFWEMSQRCPDHPDFGKAALDQWRYFKRNFIDCKRGGIFVDSQEHVPGWERSLHKLMPTGNAHSLKGTVWKDSSHDGRTFLRGIELTESSRPLLTSRAETRTHHPSTQYG